jgi:hypothetical protein
MELFPEHQSGVVQTGSLPPRSRCDLRRPDPVEIRDECGNPLWRRRDTPFVAVPDLDPSLTSPLVHCDQRSDATVRFPVDRQRDPAGLPPRTSTPRATDAHPRRRLMAPTASRNEHAHFASLRLAVLSALGRSRAPSRDTADLGSPHGRAVTAGPRGGRLGGRDPGLALTASCSSGRRQPFCARAPSWLLQDGGCRRRPPASGGTAGMMSVNGVLPGAAGEWLTGPGRSGRPARGGGRCPRVAGRAWRTVR